MRLELPFAAPWVVRETSDEQRAAIFGSPPEVAVTYGPLVLRPDNPQRWLEAVAMFDLPPGTNVEIGAPSDRQTRTGWPLRLFEVFAAGVEARLCALYSFLDHGAVAIARVKDRQRLDIYRDMITDQLEQGRPDWRGDPVCLAELWNLPQSSELDAARAEIRALYAEGKFDEGAAARAAFRRTWAAGSRLIDEYVFDHFEGIEAIETLRPSHPAVFTLLTFRAAHAAVHIDTSDGARAAGTPYVLALRTGNDYRVISMAKELPAYAVLKADVLALLNSPRSP